MPSPLMFVARLGTIIFTSTLLTKPSTIYSAAFSTRIPQQLALTRPSFHINQNNFLFIRRQRSSVLSSSIPHIQSSSSTTIRNMSTSDTTTQVSKKRVLVPIADDSEEIETTCITDVLARFGADVVVASVKSDGDLVCKMSRGIKVMADVTIEEAAKEEWDLIALPGGMPGAEHLRDCAVLIELLKKQQEQKKLYGAVCASPAVVLASKGLVGEGATCYPAGPFRDVMAGASDDSVVVQENVVTSQGPGTSLLFAISLGEQLYGKEEAQKIANALLVKL